MSQKFHLREIDGRKLAPAELDAFRAYVRAWLPDGLPRRGEVKTEEAAAGQVARHRVLQRRLWDAGLAGILYPIEYGGLGLTRAHQLAFVEETADYETPFSFSVSHGILLPTLLDFGTEEQKKRHIPASLRGEEMWVQLLSEPGAGSDLAGVLTRAARDGDSYRINGSKIWTTHAHVADYGMVLCRTNPDVPKHAGLSMFLFPLAADNKTLTIRPIRLATGSGDHFCEEFFDNFVVPAANLVGQENDGWSVALRMLFHERNMIANNSYNDARQPTGNNTVRTHMVVNLVKRLGLGKDPIVRQLLGESLTLEGLQPYARERINAAMRTGAMPEAGASLLKLMAGLSAFRQAEIMMEIAGCDGIAWDVEEEGLSAGVYWLGARIRTIGGGTNEAQCNVISERVLGLPREHAPDKGRPFSEVRHNR